MMIFSHPDNNFFSIHKKPFSFKVPSNFIFSSVASEDSDESREHINQDDDHNLERDLILYLDKSGQLDKLKKVKINFDNWILPIIILFSKVGITNNLNLGLV